MRRFLIAAMLTLMAAIPARAAVVIGVTNNEADWRVNFAAHSENVGVEIWQRCWVSSKLAWQNTALVHVESDWSEVVTHREVAGIPKGAACLAIFQVIRNAEGGVGDPQKDYDAPNESAQISWTQW